MSTQPLFKVETPHPKEVVNTIQNRIKWKEDKEEEEVEQLLRMGGDSAKDKDQITRTAYEIIEPAAGKGKDNVPIDRQHNERSWNSN